jgi:exopolysaccharide biosynthesis protein
MLVVVDGRQSGYSIGMNLIEMGDLMLSLGAVHAFNLDGGGSSVMATRPAGATSIMVANRPSDGRERMLTQALAAFAIGD